MDFQYSFDDLLRQLDSGVFANQVIDALKAAALGSVDNGKKGSVTLVFEFVRIGEGSGVQINHKLKRLTPTLHGRIVEEFSRTTHAYIDDAGYLSVSPLNQEDLFAGENNILGFHKK